jgi:hypothetical protein
MSQQLELAKGRLYGPDGLGVTNLKLFPGTRRDVTSDQVAEQINKSMSQISAGDFEDVDYNDEDHHEEKSVQGVA